MAFDTTRSYFNDLRERPVLDGQTVAEEGQVLVYVDSGSGTLAVRPSDGTAGTDAAVGAAGFAITDALKVVTKSVVEDLVVPAGGGVVSLRNQSLVTGSTRAQDTTTPATLTLVASPPAAGQYSMDLAAGTIEFNVAEAGNSVTASYRYSPTLEELLATDHERSINNRAQDYFSSASVGGLEGEIFTSHFDSSQAYTVGDAIYTGASGLATSSATSTVQIGTCSQVPSVSDGFLGVKYSGLA